MEAESHSSSGLLTGLLDGPVISGSVLDRRHILFDGYVVALTAPGEPRMPNGLACRLLLGRSTRVTVGRGRLRAGSVEILPGPGWDPVPRVVPLGVMPFGPEPQPAAVGGWAARPGPREALRAGYIAGLALLHGRRRRAELLALQAAASATPSGATMLRHAARGEVPEPVHRLLEVGDAGPLLAWSDEGMMWLRGLVSAGLPPDVAAAAPSRTVAGLRRGIA